MLLQVNGIQYHFKELYFCPPAAGKVKVKLQLLRGTTSLSVYRGCGHSSNTASPFHHYLKVKMSFCLLFFYLVFSLSTSASVSLSSTDRNQSQAEEIPWTPATSCLLSSLTRLALNQTNMAWQWWMGSYCSRHHNCN